MISYALILIAVELAVAALLITPDEAHRHLRTIIFCAAAVSILFSVVFFTLAPKTRIRHY
jgi:archaellum biogenesis protein FlaJ (TadC family)